MSQGSEKAPTQVTRQVPIHARDKLGKSIVVLILQYELTEMSSYRRFRPET